MTEQSKDGINKVNYIRYADDFIVTGKDKEILEKAKRVIQEFLETRGLELSEEKTLITHIEEGFDFLGWNFKKYNGKLLIKPSKKSTKKMIETLRETIHKNATMEQGNLIHRLNPIITGWCNYHQPICAKKTFSQIDKILFEILWTWAKRRHHKKSSHWISKRYWKKDKTRNWVFSNGTVTLKMCADVPIVRHISLKLNKNPYLDKDYFENKKIIQREKRARAYKRTVAHKLACNNIS